MPDENATDFRAVADFFHRLAEQQAVFGLLDYLGLRTDHLDVVLLEDAGLVQVEGAVQCRLAAHCRQDGDP